MGEASWTQVHACVLRTCRRCVGSLEVLTDHTQHTRSCSQVPAPTQIIAVHVQMLPDRKPPDACDRASRPDLGSHTDLEGAKTHRHWVCGRVSRRQSLRQGFG